MYIKTENSVGVQAVKPAKNYWKKNANAEQSKKHKQQIRKASLRGFGNTTSPAATVPKQAVIARTNNRAFSQQEKNQLKKYNLTALLTLSPEEIQKNC